MNGKSPSGNPVCLRASRLGSGTETNAIERPGQTAIERAAGPPSIFSQRGGDYFPSLLFSLYLYLSLSLPFSARWSRSVSQSPLGWIPPKSIDRSFLPSFLRSFVVCRSLPSNLGRTDTDGLSAPPLPAYFLDPVAAAAVTVAAAAVAAAYSSSSSQVNTAAAAPAEAPRDQLSCLVLPSKPPSLPCPSSAAAAVGSDFPPTRRPPRPPGARPPPRTRRPIIAAGYARLL